MFMKKQVIGFCVLAVVASVIPKTDGTPKAGCDIDPTQIEETVEEQTFDEYASNSINHYVDSGTYVPSPWYNEETDVVWDGRMEEHQDIESPWVTEEGEDVTK